MLESVKHLIRGGLAVHWLREREKAPVETDWSAKPVYTLEDLKRTYRSGYNVGARMGEPSRIGEFYLHVVDLDIRDPGVAGEAKAKLRELLPEVDMLPTVISGSGGESRHFYIVCSEPFRSRKLAHSAEKITGKDGKLHWAWEIELFGTGKQVAIPPSIHPDTGKPYRWLREIDFDDIDMGLGPVVSPARVRGWAAGVESGRTDEPADEDDLVSALHKRPMDLSDEEIRRTLEDLPFDDWCEDRDGWLNVGMALHHQFEGSEKGLRRWNEFSSRSKKFNAADSERVWRSFRVTAKSMRFATLMKAAAEARLKEDLSGDGFEDDEDEDVLGFENLDDDPIGETAPAKPKAPVLEWVSKLDRNEEGAIKPTLPNVSLIVRHDSRIGGLASFNLFTQEVVQRSTPGVKVVARPSPKGTKQLDGPVWVLHDPVNGDLWTEEKDHAVRDLIETPTRQGGYGIRISDRDLKAAVDIVARENSFHPVREYLERQVWDGKPRLETLFVRYLGAKDTPYSRSVARMMMVAGVARVMKPGHKFDFAVILEGLQGKRKSTFIRILAKNWFAELDGDFHDSKQMVEIMQGQWILEIPELQGFARSDVRAIKAFISRQSDKVRLAYARRAQIYHRQCILVGSTNDRKYLRDDTGGRRFWPVPCRVKEIDTDRLEAEIDQFWAEAVVAYRAMRERHGEHRDLPLFLTDEAAQTEATLIQEDRRVETAEDALAGRIEAWLDTPEHDGNGFEDEDDPVGELRLETCLVQIWVECLGRDIAAYNQITAQHLGRALDQIETWHSTGVRKRMGRYGLQRVFARKPV